MKVIMTDDKKPEICVVDNTDKTDADVTTSMRSRFVKKMTKKHVIIAVTSVVIVIVALAAILVGVKFYLDSTNRVIDRTFEFLKSKDSQEKTKEDVTADAKGKVVTYHLKEEDKEIWVVSDYGRAIEVTKVKMADGFSCYVTPLNGTPSTAESFENATSPTEVVETVNSYYDISSSVVTEKSMLGKNGEEMCDGIDVHWMIPTCVKRGSDDTPAGHRSKRLVYLCNAYHYCFYCRGRGRTCIRYETRGYSSWARTVCDTYAYYYGWRRCCYYFYEQFVCPRVMF